MKLASCSSSSARGVARQSRRCHQLGLLPGAGMVVIEVAEDEDLASLETLIESGIQAFNPSDRQRAILLQQLRQQPRPGHAAGTT
jgi:hypothetical protein